MILAMLLASCGEERQRPVYEYAFDNPADAGSRYANFYKDDSGMIYMSWTISLEEDVYAIQYSTISGGRWTMPQTVQVSTDFFVNWADFPSVVGKEGEVVAAHWLRKIEGGPYAYNVNIAFPEEQFRWTDPITPHLDGTPTEHGFVSMEPLDEETVLAVWLDGRETDGRAHHEYEDFSKAMTLRSAEVSADGEISRKRVIDQAVCDCCQTDLVRVDDGYLAVYRDRTEDEVRDISIARYDLESGEWSEPVSVWDDEWEIRACPVNGPRIFADGDRVAVVWYTGAGDEPEVRLALSSDGGETFAEPVRIAGAESVGRTDLVMTPEGVTYVSWLENASSNGYVNITKVSPDGEIADSRRVGTTSASRASGFPRITHDEEYIYVAWTQTRPHLRVRTARVAFW